MVKKKAGLSIITEFSFLWFSRKRAFKMDLFSAITDTTNSAFDFKSDKECFVACIARNVEGFEMLKVSIFHRTCLLNFYKSQLDKRISYFHFTKKRNFLLVNKKTNRLLCYRSTAWHEVSGYRKILVNTKITLDKG